MKHGLQWHQYSAFSGFLQVYQCWFRAGVWCRTQENSQAIKYQNCLSQGLIRAATYIHGCSGVGTEFPQLFLAWERVPTPFCTSNVTWRCGIQKITLKHGCDLTDGLATGRFARLVNSWQQQWNKNIQCGNSCGRMLTLFELFGSAFSFGVGTAFPHLFLARRSHTLFLKRCGGQASFVETAFPHVFFLALHLCIDIVEKY